MIDYIVIGTTFGGVRAVKRVSARNVGEAVRKARSYFWGIIEVKEED